MSDCLDNGCPPAPEGVGGLRPQGTPSTRRPHTFAASGVLFCAIGGWTATGPLPILAPALVAYGFVVANVVGGSRERILAMLATIVPAVAFGISQGAASLAGSLAPVLVALAAAGLLVKGRMTPGAGCILVAALAAALLGIEVAQAAAEGTTVSATVSQLFDTYQESLGTLSSEMAVQLEVARSVLAVIWPVAYVTAALGEVLSARFGVWLATPQMGEKARELPKLAAYDLPLWVVGAFVACAGLLAVGLTLTDVPSQVLVMVAANGLLALRYAFMAQGFAVLTWLLGRRSMGSVSQVLVGAAALLLEVQFFALTLVGLVDVWANFRHLVRGGMADASRGNEQQD